MWYLIMLLEFYHFMLVYKRYLWNINTKTRGVY